RHGRRLRERRRGPRALRLADVGTRPEREVPGRLPERQGEPRSPGVARRDRLRHLLTMSQSLAISFEGAARAVTGSRHRIAWGERSWLFDCGLYQGHRLEADRVNRAFRFEPGGL